MLCIVDMCFRRTTRSGTWKTQRRGSARRSPTRMRRWGWRRRGLTSAPAESTSSFATTPPWRGQCSAGCHSACQNVCMCVQCLCACVCLSLCLSLFHSPLRCGSLSVCDMVVRGLRDLALCCSISRYEYLEDSSRATLLWDTFCFLPTQITARGARDPWVAARAQREAARHGGRARATAQNQGDARAGHRCQGEQPRHRLQVLHGHAQKHGARPQDRNNDASSFLVETRRVVRKQIGKSTWLGIFRWDSFKKLGKNRSDYILSTGRQAQEWSFQVASDFSEQVACCRENAWPWKANLVVYLCRSCVCLGFSTWKQACLCFAWTGDALEDCCHKWVWETSGGMNI